MLIRPWALMTGALAIALLIAGGLTSLQAGTIAAALPFTVVMILMCWGLGKALSTDLAKQTSMRYARVQTSSGGDWRHRLRALTHQPRKREVLQYLSVKAQTALEEVANELRKRGLEVAVKLSDAGRINLSVGHGEEIDFLYEIRPEPYQPPAFMLDDPRRRRNDDDLYYRAEVFLREGGQDYDVMGWSKEDLIHDVLDQYQRHIHFLDNIR